MVDSADIYFIQHFADIYFSQSVCISVCRGWGGGGGGVIKLVLLTAKSQMFSMTWMLTIQCASLLYNTSIFIYVKVDLFISRYIHYG